MHAEMNQYGRYLERNIPSVVKLEDLATLIILEEEGGYAVRDIGNIIDKKLVGGVSMIKNPNQVGKEYKRKPSATAKGKRSPRDEEEVKEANLTTPIKQRDGKKVYERGKEHMA